MNRPSTLEPKKNNDGALKLAPMYPGVAVYIACREESKLIFMKDVYGLLGCPPWAFGACYKRLLIDLNLRLPSVSLDKHLAAAIDGLAAENLEMRHQKVCESALYQQCNKIPLCKMT